LQFEVSLDKKVSNTLFQRTSQHGSTCLSVIPATQEAYIGRLQSKDSPGKKHQTLCEKMKAKSTGGMAQVVECLRKKCQALSSNSEHHQNQTNKRLVNSKTESVAKPNRKEACMMNGHWVQYHISLQLAHKCIYAPCTWLLLLGRSEVQH
jgi:hypothetical protein